MQRVFHSILIACFLTVSLSAADSGLTDRLKTIRNDMMQKRMNVKSQADMQKLITEYLQNCQTLLAEYDLESLEGEDLNTAIGILLQSNQYEKAWSLLQPLLEGNEVPDQTLAMGAAASFGLDQTERGFKLLDRMNRESQEYPMMCLNFAGQQLQGPDPVSAMPFFERALDTTQLTGQRRYQVLNMYVDLAQLGTDRQKAIQFVEVSMQRGLVPKNMIGELKRMRRRLELLGQPAPEPRNVQMWTTGKESRLEDLVGKPVMLLLFEPGDKGSERLLELVKQTQKQIKPDSMEFVGFARPSSLSGLPGKGETDEQKGRALQKLLSDLDKLSLPFPVGLTDSRWTWDKYAVSGMSEAILIDKDGLVRNIIKPDTIPPVLATILKPYLPE